MITNVTKKKQRRSMTGKHIVLGSLRGGDFLNSAVTRTLAAMTDCGARVLDIDPMDAISAKQIGVIRTHMQKIDVMRPAYTREVVNAITLETTAYMYHDNPWINTEDCLDKLIEANVPFDHETVNYMAANGWLEQVKKLDAQGYWCTKHGADSAISGGHLDILKFLFSRRVFPSEIGVFSAISRGHLEIVQFLHEQGWKFTMRMVDRAIERSNLPITRLLIEEAGVTPSRIQPELKKNWPSVTDEMFDYMLLHREFFDDKVLIHVAVAAKSSTHPLEKLEEEGILTDVPSQIKDAENVRCPDVLRYLLNKGYVLDMRDVSAYVRYADTNDYRMVRCVLEEDEGSHDLVVAYAIQYGNVRAMQLCHEYNVVPDFEDIYHATTGSNATVAMVELLLNHGDFDPKLITFTGQNMNRVNMKVHCYLMARGAQMQSVYYPFKEHHLETPELLRGYHEAGIRLPDHVMNTILPVGSLETVKYAHEVMGLPLVTANVPVMNRTRLPATPTRLAAQNSAACLAYVYEKLPQARLEDDGILELVRRDQFDTLEVALSRVDPRDFTFPVTAVNHCVNVKWAKLLLKYGMQFPPYFADHAVIYGDVELVRFLIHEQGMFATSNAMRNAMSDGTPEMVKYLLEEEKVSWSCEPEDLARAALHGHAEKVSIALERGVRCPDDLADRVVSSALCNVNVLEVLHQHGYRCSATGANMALTMDNRKALEVIFAHGVRCTSDHIHKCLRQPFGLQTRYSTLRFVIQNTPGVEKPVSDYDMLKLFEM